MMDEAGEEEVRKEVNENWWLQFVPDSKRWSDVNIVRFLSIYKVHPILWDPKHSFYNDPRRRIKAYGIIAKRLNLFGVREKECIELVKSLRSFYATEKERQKLAIAEKCFQEYALSPCWYRMLEELIECVKKRLTKAAPESRVKKTAELTKPWERCCQKLYTEEMWTPEHFRTNITNWFLGPEDEEQPLCTCPEAEVSGSISECICYAEKTVSTDESSGEIVPCMAHESSSSSSSSTDAKCCFDIQNFRSQSGRCEPDVSDEEVKKYCCEGKLHEFEDTHIHCCTTSESDRKMIKETNQSPLENINACGTEECLKSRSTRYSACGMSFNPPSKSEESSIQELSIDCCRSHRHSNSNSNSLTPTSDSSSSSPGSESGKSLSREDDGSARTRPDIRPDVTQCEKCAVERVQMINPKSRKVIFEEDPRMPDLDEYCRYKDWDTIYNIRTRVTYSDEEIAIFKGANEKSTPMPIRAEDKRSRPSLQNHSPKETDGLIFTDQNLSEFRQVSLIDEYNREYGMNVPINQRKHFACQDSDNLVYRPAQLML